MCRSKGWTFLSFDSEPTFDADTVQYLVYNSETISGRPCLRGFVWFRERRRFPFLRDWLPGAKFVSEKDRPRPDREYCSRTGDSFREFGRFPRVTSGGEAFRSVLEKAEENRISEIKDEYPGIFIRYKPSILSCVRYRTDELDHSCGVWICGPPRCGKDASVRRLGQVFVKPLTKWWCGYNDERYVLISDVEPDHGKWLGFYLKIWADRYPFVAEIKGSSIRVRPQKIFCTSNFTLEEVFDDQILSALRARFTVFDEFDGTVTRRKEAALTSTIYDKLLAHEEGLSALPPQEQLHQCSNVLI